VEIKYTKQAKDQLLKIKKFIALDNKLLAIKYLTKIKRKVEMLSMFPYVGKINSTLNSKNVRDYIVCGYKVIYKVNVEAILIVAIYKNIIFNEKTISNKEQGS
jgi:plasmid stabilization system protein ParE